MAVSAESSSRRLDTLSNPKSLPSEYFEDRPSIYWVDRLPPEPVDGKTEFITTERVNQLAQPKKDSSHTFDRSHEELSQVSKSALSGQSSERVIHLANPKSLHSNYKYERSVYTTVPDSARNAVCTPRVEQLARSKALHLAPIPVASLGYIHDPIIPVASTAKHGSCTPRLEQLAEHKQVPNEYKIAKPVQWPILPAVINASATTRLQQLARPKSSKDDDKDYDPYKVPLAAIRARASARVEELCVPLPRKCRQKKVV